MTDALYSRREWLTFVITLAPTLALVGCVFQSQPPGGGTGNGGSTDASSSPTSTAGAGSEIGSYSGTTLDRVRDAKVQGIDGVQRIGLGGYRLKVTGKIGNALSLTYDEVRSLTSVRRLVTLPCVEGWSVVHVWDGVLVRDLLERAGYNSSATTVIFHSADSYTTSLPLKFVLENDVLLGWAVNGVVLPVEYGYPFRVVAQHRLGYKWGKWITEIEVSDDKNYEGYWEQRGYSNDAATNR